MKLLNWNRRGFLGFILLVGCTATLTSCSLFDPFGGSRTYRGQVALGFEVVAFRPCDGTEQWWMTGGDVINDLQQQYNALGVDPYEPVFARLTGSTSGRGTYGHLGAYEREFEVKDILEVRLLDEAECPIATPE
jgi:hypothetical protein